MRFWFKFITFIVAILREKEDIEILLILYAVLMFSLLLLIFTRLSKTSFKRPRAVYFLPLEKSSPFG